MKDRIISRGMGCWNCIHSSHAGSWWVERRLANLKEALRISQESALGENEPKVINIRRMTDQLDHAVAHKKMIRCTTGVTATGEPVGDLTPDSYLCGKWSGAQGSSIAREGAGPEKLPEELMEDMHFGKPMSVTQYLESQGRPQLSNDEKGK